MSCVLSSETNQELLCLLFNKYTYEFDDFIKSILDNEMLENIYNGWVFTKREGNNVLFGLNKEDVKNAFDILYQKNLCDANNFWKTN